MATFCDMYLMLVDDLVQLDNQTFKQNHISHVIGMCQFKEYLAGTPGEIVLEFWKDAQKFHQIPEKNERVRKLRFREMQVKYFSVGGGFTNLEDNSAWDALSGSC